MKYLIRAAGLSLCLLMPLWLASCNEATPESDASNSTAPETAVTESPTATPEESPSIPETNPDSNLISGDGIGAAKLGMTLGELKQILGDTAEFEVQAPFIVDFDAIAVRQNGEIQYYVLYLAGQSLADSDPIQGLLTTNPAFQTAEGVGVGTLVSDAEAAYGDATLAYSTENESREYVRFDNHPASNLSFGTGNGSTEAAGIYPDPRSEYNETQEYQDTAAIESVLVVCFTEACAL